MVNIPFGSTPTQDAVSQNELYALRFALDPPMKPVQSLKHFHRSARRPLLLRPLVARKFPAMQRRDPRFVLIESFNPRVSRFLRFIPGISNRDLLRGVVPTGLKPTGNLFRRLRRPRQNGPLHLQQKLSRWVILASLIFLGSLGLRSAGLHRSPLDRGMVRQPMKPQAPRLFANLAVRM